MTIKFAHIQNGDDRRTIGYAINDTDRTVHFAVARCRSGEPFNKRLGRDIVTARIAKGGAFADPSRGMRSHVVTLEAIGSDRYKEILAFIIDHS